jgi:hypothetical protein
MSTIDTFQEMSGINETSCLRVTAEQAQEIIDTVSATVDQEPASPSTPITLMPVATYVTESKREESGVAYLPPKQPPFSSHWGVVVDELASGEAYHVSMFTWCGQS